MIDDQTLRAIERDARERFEERFEAEGVSPTALGWDAEESMRVRFAAATDLYDFRNAAVLDIGCGFGDFLEYLREQDLEPATYRGVDISDDILEVAREAHPEPTFERRNPLVDPYEDETFDVAVAFGVCNYELERVSNEAYLRALLWAGYACSDTVLLNALSRYREGDWEYEEFVHYYDPGAVFGYAQELSRDVTLKHDFDPIPQKEFHLLVE